MHLSGFSGAIRLARRASGAGASGLRDEWAGMSKNVVSTQLVIFLNGGICIELRGEPAGCGSCDFVLDKCAFLGLL
jgi:hypothetical protein